MKKRSIIVAGFLAIAIIIGMNVAWGAYFKKHQIDSQRVGLMGEQPIHTITKFIDSNLRSSFDSAISFKTSGEMIEFIAFSLHFQEKNKRIFLPLRLCEIVIDDSKVSPTVEFIINVDDNDFIHNSFELGKMVRVIIRISAETKKNLSLNLTK